MDTLCVLCKEEQETCKHLFFGCRYAGKVWRDLIGGVMKDEFTVDWDEIYGKQSLILAPDTQKRRCS